jgi:DDE superfamily endonuclease
VSGVVGRLPAGVLPVVDSVAGRAVRVVRRGVVYARAGDLAARVVAGRGAPAWARVDVRGLADGRMDVDRLRIALAGLDLPRGSDGQIRLAVDVTPWPRPDAECSPQRAHAHRPCRCDGVRQTIPGWPYSIVAVLESGRSSWTAPLDAMRLVPGDDATEVTATQIRDVLARLWQAGQWRAGDPPVLVVLDAGYDVIRLAFLLRDIPVRLLARIRSDRVFYAPAQRYAGTGRPSRHGPAMKLDDPGTWPAPEQAVASVHERYGNVAGTAWGRYHPPAAAPRRLGSPSRASADRGGHPHPRAGRSAARRPGPETGVAVAQPPARGRPGRAAPVPRVPAPLRPGAHVPVPQANPRMDPAPAASSRPGRPVDLADPGRLHPATAGSRPRRRLAPSLGDTVAPRPAYPRPSPPRVFPHPPDDRAPCRCAETLPPRPRPPERHAQQQPSTPLPR